MRKRCYALALAALAVAALMAGCSAVYKPEIAAVNTDGNTPFNIAVGGRIAWQDGYTYSYQTANRWNQGEGLYCAMLDGKDSRKLDGGRIGSINAVGDWVYYVRLQKDSQTGSLYRVMSDGSGQKRLLDGCRSVLVTANTITYIGADGRLYRADTESLQPSAFAGQGVEDYSIDKSTLYWRQADGIYAMAQGGGTPKQLVTDKTSAWCVADGQLYWAAYDTAAGSNTVSIKDLSTGKTSSFKLAGKEILRLSPYKGMLFLCTGGELIRTDMDGGNPVSYGSASPDSVYFFEDMIELWAQGKSPVLLENSSVSFATTDITLLPDATETGSLAFEVDSSDYLAQVIDEYGIKRADGLDTALTDQYDDSFFENKELILAIVKAKNDVVCSVRKLAYSKVKSSVQDLALNIYVNGEEATGSDASQWVGFLIEVSREDVKYTGDIEVVVEPPDDGE
jgi:hypothetical protein